MLEGIKSVKLSLNGVLSEAESLNGTVAVSTRTVPYYEEANEYGITIYISEEVLA